MQRKGNYGRRIWPAWYSWPKAMSNSGLLKAANDEDDLYYICIQYVLKTLDIRTQKNYRNKIQPNIQRMIKSVNAYTKHLSKTTHNVIKKSHLQKSRPFIHPSQKTG